MNSSGPAPLGRRRLLQLGGAAGLAALVGCANNEESSTSATDLPSTSTSTTTTAVPATPEFVRTPEDRFEGLVGFDYEPHYINTAEGLRLHYLDEGSGDAGVALLLHGEPTWCYLYRNVIPTLAAAGFRCIAPDHIGFGKSDKVTDDDWYTLDAHVATLHGVIEDLDLSQITLVCQDWGGPNGLITAVDLPDRFRRLVVLNTWLHHDGYEYSEHLVNWNTLSQNPEFDFGVVGYQMAPWSVDEAPTLHAAYAAPFTDHASKTGARRWPWMLPFAEPEAGGADRQATAYAALANTDVPTHVIFGDSDRAFTAEWGAEFAGHLGATFDLLPGVGHFVQETGPLVAELILQRSSDA
jgi:haloalkane dehalogenase